MFKTYILDLRASKTGEGIRAVRGGHQSCLAEVVLGLEVAHLRLVWPVHDANGNGEHSVALGLVPNRFVNDIMVLNHLFLDGVGQVLQTQLLLLQIDVAQTAIEENLARVKLEEKTKLGIIDDGVATEVEEGVVKIGEGLLEITEEKVRNTLLEVGDGEIEI